MMFHMHVPLWIFHRIKLTKRVLGAELTENDRGYKCGKQGRSDNNGAQLNLLAHDII